MKFYWKLAAYLDTSNQNKNERNGFNNTTKAPFNNSLKAPEQ